jgi:hypothetical protein
MDSGQKFAETTGWGFQLCCDPRGHEGWEAEAMTFRRGQKIEIYRQSDDESWQDYMNKYVGMHGIITDPDASKNDPEALIEVSLDEKGTHRFPQDCLRPLED